jgi:hypothetical protein
MLIGKVDNSLVLQASNKHYYYYHSSASKYHCFRGVVEVLQLYNSIRLTIIINII